MRIAYLIGQYPAINHYYLPVEIQQLRVLGWSVTTASIGPPDRPLERLLPEEQEEAAQVWVVKATPPAAAFAAVCLELIRAPLRAGQAFLRAIRLGRGSPGRRLRHLLYFVEALLVGRWMRAHGLRHLHVSFAGTVGLLVAECYGITLSLGIYGYGELRDPGGGHLAAKIARARLVRSVSQHGVNELMLSSPRSEWARLVHVPLGVLPERFPPRVPPPPGGRVNLLCVGRLSAEKGQTLMLDAVERLAALDLPVTLHLVGDGPDRDILAAQASQPALAGVVVLHGMVDQAQLMELYRHTDIFVLSSLSEGIPIVLMEAMCMEIPCVAPRLTGIPELIQDGRDGLLYTPASVPELSRALEALVRDPGQRQALGKAGRERVLRDYDLARNSRRFEAILRERLAPANSVQPTV